MTTRILAFVVTLAAIAQNNMIEWSPSRKLSWKDFKCAPDPKSGNAALTNTAITIDFSYNESSFQYDIKCRFDKTKSWVRVKNNEVLLHEQGHFDLAEIYARKLNQALKAYKFNAKTVASDVNTIYNDMMNQHRDAQDEYDEETDYSRNKAVQQEWIKKIAAELENLKAYANYSKQ